MVNNIRVTLFAPLQNLRKTKPLGYSHNCESFSSSPHSNIGASILFLNGDKSLSYKKYISGTSNICEGQNLGSRLMHISIII